jgi:DNA-binding PadR family transcriptional regulator
MAPRMTIPTQLVLHVLLADPEEERYGYEIGESAGLASGTVHPILARLEGAGWVESRWEDVDVRAAGRPARRYYRLTADGAQAAPDALARAHRPRRPWLAPQPSPGTS